MHVNALASHEFTILSSQKSVCGLRVPQICHTTPEYVLAAVQLQPMQLRLPSWRALGSCSYFLAGCSPMKRM